MRKEIQIHTDARSASGNTLADAIASPSIKELMRSDTHVPTDRSTFGRTKLSTSDWKGSLSMAVKRVITMMGVPASSIYDSSTPEGAAMKEMLLQDLAQSFGFMSPEEIVIAFRYALTGKLSGLPKGWESMYGEQISFKYFATVLTAYNSYRATIVRELKAKQMKDELNKPPTADEMWKRECRFYFEDLYPLIQQRKHGKELTIEDPPEIGWAAIHLYMRQLKYIDRNPTRDKIVREMAKDAVNEMTGKEAADPQSELYSVYLNHFADTHYVMLCKKMSVQLWIDTHIFNPYGEDHDGMNSNINEQ
jgi:hypothetical protein